MIARKKTDFTSCNQRTNNINFLIWSLFVQDISQCIIECDKGFTSTSTSISNKILLRFIAIKQLFLIFCERFNLPHNLSVDRLLSFHLPIAHSKWNRTFLTALSSCHNYQIGFTLDPGAFDALCRTSFHPGCDFFSLS